MKNIFENAKFGDKFRTRDGRMALYLGIHPKFNTHILTTENKEKEPYWCFYSYMNNGLFDVENPKEHPLNIVAEWQEPINEEELDRLAEESNPNNPHGDTYEVGQYFGFQDGFQAGYRKAKEE